MDMAIVGQFIEKINKLKTPLPHDMTILWLGKIYTTKKKKTHPKPT